MKKFFLSLIKGSGELVQSEEMASTTTSTYENILRTLPGSFVRSKLFRIVMQIRKKMGIRKRRKRKKKDKNVMGNIIQSGKKGKGKKKKDIKKKDEKKKSQEPKYCCMQKIDKGQLQVLASSTSYDDKSTTPPQLTFIFNHTVIPSFDSVHTSMNNNIINRTNEVLSNITFEHIHQQMDHPK
ncbi:unnamed protein product [Onchocerca flexuosa]|uniref:Uncharacterized protein n=1 Tax=Onchocerca flexuosa TaxID=387005 RepID=A0A183H4W9_9BILA|nr:unnamed protein product [Onchocerca flexuosa]